MADRSSGFSPQPAFCAAASIANRSAKILAISVTPLLTPAEKWRQLVLGGTASAQFHALKTRANLEDVWLGAP
jgi:hypothetical protein